MPKLEIFGKTETGPVRARNEDHILVLDHVINHGERLISPTKAEDFANTHDGLWVAVADGVGGSAAGSEASRITATRLADSFAADVKGLNAGQLVDYLDQTLRSINDQVIAEGEQSEGQLGMSSTVSGMLIKKSAIFIFNAGDSRVYRWRDGQLTQVTTDDAKPGMIAEMAGMTLSEAVESGSASLTNCIGMRSFEPRLTTGLEFRTGDVFLVCTDGLFGMISREVIASVLAQPASPLGEKGKRLFDLAVEAGGSDNISLVLVGSQDP